MGKDPVKHCKLYKDDGCAHVDGYLCDFETCSMRLDYALRVHTEGGYEVGLVEEAEEFSRKRNYDIEAFRKASEDFKHIDMEKALRNINRPGKNSVDH